MELRKAVLKTAKRMGLDKVSKQAKKIPAPIRKGWAMGAMVPVPGGATAGTLAGTAVWGKDKIERAVRTHTQQPWRMFMERYIAGKVQPVEASDKLDGVYARASAAGVFSKSGKPLDVPHVS